MHNNDKPNRLINEKSPYLLQHAYNPVDWYPWCDEAFTKAKAEDKPIFLSIGYSTCHWCHVMAHESFEDEEVAEVINLDYIPIKVDKEERPDVDAVYMTVCQILTGGGGWPLTIVMTPDQKPFFAGTYFPKNKRYNILGIVEILNDLTLHWKENRQKVDETADKIVDILNNQTNRAVGDESDPHREESLKEVKELFYKSKEFFAENFDAKYGGFSHSPKFPTPHNLMFLLRYYRYEKDEQALSMVLKTLRQMYLGGIFDHIGYGFSRYSTDDQWLVPHFEKMLYDNALLAIAYLESYEITNVGFYRDVTEKIFDYVMREMTNPEGAFYSAQDADSEGVEGKYYVFSQDEIINVLGEEDGKAFCQYFDIRKKPNFEEGNIPNLIGSPNFKNDDVTIDDSMKSLCEKLYQYRINRTFLHKDDKILTSWNALMLIAYAKAYGALGNEKYLSLAEDCQKFLEQKLINSKDNKLYIRFREGKSVGQGTLDEYAFYIWALATLYEVTFKTEYLDKAVKYCKLMIDLFWDEEGSGFFLTAKDAENLIYRPKEIYDGAIPSGNSVAAYVLVKLKKLTGLTEINDICERQLSYIKRNIENYPSAYSFSMMALMMDYYKESFLCENGVCS